MSDKKVLVFIDGPCPDEIAVSLAASHRTREFRNVRDDLAEEPHDLAVSADPSIIPEWGKTE